MDNFKTFTGALCSLPGLITYFVFTIAMYVLNIVWTMELQTSPEKVNGCDVDKVLAINWTALFSLLVPFILFFLNFVTIRKNSVEEKRLFATSILLLSMMNIPISSVNFNLVGKRVTMQQGSGDAKVQAMNAKLIATNVFLLLPSVLFLVAGVGELFVAK